jgi:hypothetical protein
MGGGQVKPGQSQMPDIVNRPRTTAAPMLNTPNPGSKSFPKLGGDISAVSGILS